MYLALSSKIVQIDEYSEKTLKIPLRTLMERSGRAVERALRENVKPGSRVVLLAGSGNNGGDGYAFASMIADDYDTVIYDIFDKGQKTDEGNYFLSLLKKKGAKIIPLTLDDETLATIKGADCIVDAVFGTGFVGEMPEIVGKLIAAVNSSHHAFKIAIDVPLGVNADDGTISEAYACSVNLTVSLCFIKPGLVSYPARSFVGKIVYDDIGLPLDKLEDRFDFKYMMTDGELASRLLPERTENGSKGSFGKLLMITGSDKYRGAAHLTAEGALRGGVGYVVYFGNESLSHDLSLRFPEIVFEHTEGNRLTDADVSRALSLSKEVSAILIGSGSSVSDELYSLISSLLSTDGAPLILDADAINAMAEHREEALRLLRDTKRSVVLTPHPLEFARLKGTSVKEVQSARIGEAMEFAEEYGCTLILKGAGTVVASADKVYINSTGSSALSKAGTGDVLAGLVSSLIASGGDPTDSGAAAVYYHGLAADVLADELSVFGVTPSDLPREIARRIADGRKSK